jgi:hypothetical protein
MTFLGHGFSFTLGANQEEVITLGLSQTQSGSGLTHSDCGRLGHCRLGINSAQQIFTFNMQT